MRGRGLALSFVLLVASAVGAHAQTWRTVNAYRQQQNEKALRVNVEYGAGRFTIVPGERGLLYRIGMRYDADRFETLREYRNREGTATLRLGVEHTDAFSVKGVKEGAGSLDLALAPDLPTDLDLEFGAVEANLELGGMHLTRLSIRTGASDSRIRFGEPNAVTIRSCSFEAGAAAFRVEGLGNARCENLHFEGGVGDVVLDFGGRADTNTRARIEVGLGSLTLRVPESLGLSLEKESFLASFDTPQMSRSGDRWVSDNWDRARHHVTLTVKAALGSVNVVWIAE